MKKISSLQNKLVIQTAKLGIAKERTKQNRFVVEGLRALEAFAQAGKQPLDCFATKELLNALQHLFPSCLVIEVTEPVMTKMSQARTPSGLLCTFPVPTPQILPAVGPVLVLAQVADPGNMGTLIRTAVALKLYSIAVIEGTDPWSPKVVQASAGTIAHARIIPTSWPKLVQKKADRPLCGLVVTGGTAPHNTDLTNALLVVGSEAHGIPASWLRDCDTLVTLPMPGEAESLNASVAGSIALYLAWQQRAGT